jgi:uncharacterized FlaG/YvyC family protein
MDVVSSQAVGANSSTAAANPVTISPAPPAPDPGTAHYTLPAVPSAPASVATPSSAAQTSGTPVKASGETATFHAAVGAVFNGSEIDVSFRVAHDPNQIVIVYRNAQTGEVVNQIPSEAIIQLAEFFQREATGALVDKGA